LGIVVPDELAKKLRLKPGDDLVLDIAVVETERAFGSMSDWRVDPQRLKDELREA
jgi:bifunctional DNA-binding transcriptional regulator/antitoxin component of YhaV-PrlF toxin-antitoxin module